MLKDGQAAALLRAADNNSVSGLEILLENQYNIMGLDDDDRTLLHGTSVHGRPDVVLFLNKNGPNRDGRDRYGLPALHEASRNGHVQVVDCWRT